MEQTKCGADCAVCEARSSCGGCAATDGHPFGGSCMVAECCRRNGKSRCGECGDLCSLKRELIAEFNALGIADLPEVTDLNALIGAYINLAYTLPSGQAAKFWRDDKVYLGNQLCKQGSDRCYGLTADEHHLLVCEYGAGGADAEIVVFKRR